MNIFLYVAVYCASVLTPIIPIRVSPDNDSAIVIYTDSTCKAIEKRFSSKELRETEVYVSFNKDSKLAAGDKIWTWVEGEIQPEFFGWVKKEHCRVSFSDDIYLFREPDIYSAKERFAINRPISADVLSVRDGWLELRLNYGGEHIGWFLQDGNVRSSEPFDNMNFDYLQSIFGRNQTCSKRHLDFSCLFSKPVEEIIRIFGEDYSASGVMASPTYNDFLRECLFFNEYFTPAQYAIKIFRWKIDRRYVYAVCMPQDGDLPLPASLLWNSHNLSLTANLGTEKWIAHDSGTGLWKIFCITDDVDGIFPEGISDEMWSKHGCATPSDPSYDKLYSLYLSEPVPVLRNGNVVFDDVKVYLGKSPASLSEIFGQPEGSILHRLSEVMPVSTFAWHLGECMDDRILELYWLSDQDEKMSIFFKKENDSWSSFFVDMTNYDALPLIE